MKNLHKIMVILVLISNTIIHLDIYAAGGKRKAQDTGNKALCFKKNHTYNEEQRQIDLALFEATRTSNTPLVATLLAQKANPNALTSFHYERTPLHMAARNGNLDCLILLLQNGAKVNTVTDHFLTPLHEAVCIFNRYSGVACIELLLREGAKINAQNNKKNTPLHLATIACLYYYVEVLLAWGADHTLHNAEGKTPLMIAEEKRFGAIIDLLKAPAKVEEMDIS